MSAALSPSDVIAIRQAKTALRNLWSLHNLTRHTLNSTTKNALNYNVMNLDGYFPWRQQVAARVLSRENIGPGITHVSAVLVPGTRDRNRGGMLRLDFFFFEEAELRVASNPGS